MATAALALAGAGMALSPAVSAVSDLVRTRAEHPVSLEELGSISSFTPSIRDSRLANAYARIIESGGQGDFRFTPTSGSMSGRRSITIAVRSPDGQSRSVDAPISLGVTPVAYNLGVSRGWRRFALPDSVGKRPAAPISDLTAAEGFDLKDSSRLTTRVRVEGAVGGAGQGVVATDPTRNGAVDVASSYALTRNLNVTAGIRYRGPTSRLAPLTDERQDNQAVYVGTIFKF